MEAILTALLFFFLFIWLSGRLMPRLLAWYLKRKMGIDHKGGAERSRGWRKDNEGEIEIKYSEPREKVIDKNIGEYIDFEEKRTEKS